MFLERLFPREGNSQSVQSRREYPIQRGWRNGENLPLCAGRQTRDRQPLVGSTSLKPLGHPLHHLCVIDGLPCVGLLNSSLNLCEQQEPLHCVLDGCIFRKILHHLDDLFPCRHIGILATFRTDSNVHSPRLCPPSPLPAAVRPHTIATYEVSGTQRHARFLSRGHGRPQLDHGRLAAGVAAQRLRGVRRPDLRVRSTCTGPRAARASSPSCSTSRTAAAANWPSGRR